MPWKTDKTPPSYIGKEGKEILKTSDFGSEEKYWGCFFCFIVFCIFAL